MNECPGGPSGPACSQLCSYAAGSYSCSCLTGYALAEDGYSCDGNAWIEFDFVVIMAIILLFQMLMSARKVPVAAPRAAQTPWVATRVAVVWGMFCEEMDTHAMVRSDIGLASTAYAPNMSGL